jgi:hypothetical protein
MKKTFLIIAMVLLSIVGLKAQKTIATPLLLDTVIGNTNYHFTLVEKMKLNFTDSIIGTGISRETNPDYVDLTSSNVNYRFRMDMWKTGAGVGDTLTLYDETNIELLEVQKAVSDLLTSTKFRKQYIKSLNPYYTRKMKDFKLQ